MGKHQIATLQPRIGKAQLQRAPALTATDRVTGRRLQARRRRYFRDHPLCACCTEQGRVSAAVELDHIIPLHMGGSDTEGNWQGLCLECHEAKSERERQARQAGEAVYQTGYGGQISVTSRPETDTAPTDRFF